jgi:hypothetical protein
MTSVLALQTRVEAQGGGGGNATVPGGTNPSDPQDFVDAAVFLGEGDYSIRIGEGFPFSAVSLTNLDRVVFLPTTVAGPRTYNFEFATGGMWMCPDLASLAGTLKLTGGGVVTPVFPSLTTPFTGHLDLSNNDIVTPGLGAGWTAFAGTLLNLSYNSIVTPGFSSLTSLTGYLALNNNSIITPGFSGLTSLSGALDLSNNPIVAPGFAALTTLSGTLNLSGTAITQGAVDTFISNLAASITTGGGFLDLTSLTGGADVSISPDIAALEALITVTY